MKESGDNQSARPLAYLPQPLTVLVRDANAAPIVNAPVVFAIEAGDGSVAPMTGSAQSWMLEARTDANGRAQARFFTGTHDGVSTIIASAQSGIRSVSVTFTATTQAVPGRPESLDFELAAAGGVELGWSEAKGVVAGYTVEQSTDRGVTWTPLVTAAGTATSATAATANEEAVFRVSATNSTGASSRTYSVGFGAQDEDNDGLTNQEESDEGTNMRDPDCDDDGVPDGSDVAPLDPELTQPRLPPAGWAIMDLTEEGLPANNQPFEINDRGDILASVWAPMVLNADGTLVIPPLFSAWDINNNGQVIGNGGDGRASIWSPNSSSQNLDPAVPSLSGDEFVAYEFSDGRALNDNGKAVGLSFQEIWVNPYVVSEVRCIESGLLWDFGVPEHVGATWEYDLVYEEGEYRSAVVLPRDVNNAGFVVGSALADDLWSSSQQSAFITNAPYSSPYTSLPKTTQNSIGVKITENRIVGGAGSDRHSGFVGLDDRWYPSPYGSAQTVNWDIPVFWVQSGGAWREKFLGQWNGSANERISGGFGGINSSLEITGIFTDYANGRKANLWRNGRLYDLAAVPGSPWFGLVLAGINKDGTSVGTAQRKTTGEVVPVKAVKVEFLIPRLGSNRQIQNDPATGRPLLDVASRLKIGKMIAPDGQPQPLTGTGDNWTLAPENDPDHFYVRVWDPAARGKRPRLRLTTEHILEDDRAANAGVRTRRFYSDNAVNLNILELADDPDNPGAVISKSLLLVCGHADDQHPVDNVQDNALNDRTRIIYLGGSVRAEYLGAAGAPKNLVHRAIPVPEDFKFILNVITLRDTFGDITAQQREFAALQEIYTIRERYAQVGVRVLYRLTIATADPPEYDEDLGMKVFGWSPQWEPTPDNPFPPAVKGYSSQVRSFLTQYAANRDPSDVVLFLTKRLDQINLQTQPGELTIGRWVNPVEIAQSAEDTNKPETIFAWVGLNRYTAAHELGHVLIGPGHPPNNIKLMSQDGGFQTNDFIGNTKRIGHDEEMSMLTGRGRAKLKKP